MISISYKNKMIVYNSGQQLAARGPDPVRNLLASQ
jgi:hypothetical protein